MSKILQLKISLKGFRPQIWRRFLVEDSITFYGLHEIIQEVMGWENYHMYEFHIGDEIITLDEEGFNPAEGAFKHLFDSPEFLEMLKKRNSNNTPLDLDKINKILEKQKNKKPKKRYIFNDKINELIKSEKQKFSYTYDFGDNWGHSIVVEKISEKDKSQKYPICVGGKMACPPEDSGGVWGYGEMLEIKEDKNHPEYEEKIIDWLGEDFDPEEFDVDEINKRL